MPFNLISALGKPPGLKCFLKYQKGKGLLAFGGRVFLRTVEDTFPRPRKMAAYKGRDQEYTYHIWYVGKTGVLRERWSCKLPGPVPYRLKGNNYYCELVPEGNKEPVQLAQQRYNMDESRCVQHCIGHCILEQCDALWFIPSLTTIVLLFFL